MENGFTDKVGVALAEALTVNKSLRMLSLSTIVQNRRDVHNGATLGVQSYEALATMLRVNTSLVLDLPPLDDAVDDERFFESCGQLCMEQRLNKVGRGKLLSPYQTTKKEWVNVLHELNSNDYDDYDDCDEFDVTLDELSSNDESDAFRLSCLFSLFRLNPEIVSMS